MLLFGMRKVTDNDSGLPHGDYSTLDKVQVVR